VEAFTQELLQVDLSSLGSNVVDMDMHQPSGFLYLLLNNGDVYKCRTNGDELAFVFSTGFTDVDELVIDNVNGRLIIGTHEITPTNRRFYGYSLVGASLFNYEARSGGSSFAGGLSAVGFIGSDAFVYYLTGGTGTNSFRFRLSDGLVTNLQELTPLSKSAGSWDDVTNQSFQGGGSALYQRNPLTENNPIDAFQVAGNLPSANNDYVHFFQGDDGVNIWIGCGGGKIWSWRVNDDDVTQDRTANNYTTLCTRHAYGTPS
jgi:hypothetical protein